MYCDEDKSNYPDLTLFIFILTSILSGYLICKTFPACAYFFAIPVLIIMWVSYMFSHVIVWSCFFLFYLIIGIIVKLTYWIKAK